MPLAEQRRIIRAYQGASERVRGSTVATLEKAWLSLGAWRDDDVARFVKFAVPVVTGAQTQAAALTAGYLALTLSDMTGRTVAPRGVAPELVTGLRRVDPAVVYARPASTLRMSLAEGLPIGVAVERGRQRLVGITTSDVQLARTHMSRAVLATTPGVTGFRRAVTGTCELCSVDSVAMYQPDAFMPTHPNCACSPVPIVGGLDPARLIDRDLIDGERLDDVAVSVFEHGELGPVLAFARHAKTGVGDVVDGTVVKAAKPVKVATAPAQAARPATPAQAARSMGLEIRAPLAEAHTVYDIELQFQLEAQRITGRVIPAELGPAASPATARESLEGVLRGLERFPDAKLDWIGHIDDVDRYAQAGGGIMEFSTHYTSVANRTRYLTSLQRDIAGWEKDPIVHEVVPGWSVRASGNPAAVAIHEFAHILDLDTIGPLELNSSVEELVRTLAAREGKTADRLIRRQVGGYAMTDTTELIAEAFTDAIINGAAASELSRGILALIEKAYAKGGGRVGASGALRAARKAAPAANLSTMTVTQLRAMAKAQGIAIKSKALKADIIKALGGGTASDGLASMTVAQLRLLAKQRGVTLAAKDRKADILAKLEPRGSRPVPKPATSVETVTAGDFRGLRRVGAQGGSNPGGIFAAEDGSRWYIKAASSEQWAKEQALASTLYRELGIESPEIFIGKGVGELGAGPQTATRILDVTGDGLTSAKFLTRVREGFATDAWLADWDVGQAGNIMSLGGVPVRMDIGGSLRFRARGGSKGGAFGESVSEWLTLRDTRNVSGRLFKGITLKELEASVKRVADITPDRIRALVKAQGLDAKLADLLVARRKDIMDRLAADLKASMPHEFGKGVDHLAGADRGATLAAEVVKLRKKITNAADETLSAIARIQGFDGVPTLLTRAEMTKALKAQGAHPVIFRGVKAAGAKTAQDVQEMMRSGDAYFGNGVYGNGYYFSTARATAVSYSNKTAASVVRATIRPDAKIITYGDALQQHRAFLSSMSSGVPLEVYQDIGRWAMAQGYDVILQDFANRRISADAESYYIILNRSILMVEKAPARKAT